MSSIAALAMAAKSTEKATALAIGGLIMPG